MDDMLETEFAGPFADWKAQPGPAANAAMLKTLQPVIEGAIRTHVGEPNPLLLSKARSMTLDGLASYDPARGRLKSHLYNHLQGLKRVNRQQTTVLRVPERIALDRYHLENAEQELSHRLGREPTDAELTDHLGVSAKRLAAVRSYQPGYSEGQSEELGGGGTVGGVEHGSGSLAHAVVYDELDDYHKAIMEHGLGMNGRPVLPNHEIARKLRRSPGAISQAKLRIQRMLDDAQDLNPFGS